MVRIHLLHLPVDILLNIIKKLTISDLRSLILTSKALRNLILNNNTIWRTLYHEKLILHNSSGNSQYIGLSWYNRCRISQNWCNGIYKSKKLVQHHTNYMPWVKYHDSEALLLTVGTELHCHLADKKGLLNCRDSFWSLDVPKVKRYDVRTNDISRFVVKDGLLTCGNRDGSAAVYKLHDIKRKPQLLSHIEDCHENGHVEVTAVEVIQNFNKSYIITASINCPKIKLWHWVSEESDMDGFININDVIDIPTYENAGVRCLALNNTSEKLAIGLNGNSKPLLLDVNTGEFIITADETRNNKRAIRDIQWHNENTIIYVTHSGLLQFIDIRTCEVVYDEIDPFQSTLYCLKSDGNNAVVVGSSEYSRCVLFDWRVCGQHVQMYFTQKNRSPVYSLDFDSTKLIAAVDRGVGVLNFNVNVSTTPQRDYSDVFEYSR